MYDDLDGLPALLLSLLYFHARFRQDAVPMTRMEIFDTDLNKMDYNDVVRLI